jgi:hypothetical protein
MSTVSTRDGCCIMTVVAVDHQHAQPEQGKPGESPGGSDSYRLTDQINDDAAAAGVPDGECVFDPAGNDESSGERADLREGEQGVLAEREELVAWLKEKLANADNRAFTASTQAEIRDEIKDLHAEVRKQTELNARQLEAIDKKLTDVQRGSERMGQKDWVTFTLGVATSLVIVEFVPPLALLPLAVHAIHRLGHLLIIDASASP